MKNLILLFLILVPCYLFSQNYGPPKHVTIPTTTTYLPEVLAKNSHITVTSIPGWEFVTNIPIGRPRQFSYLLEDSTRYTKFPLAYNLGKLLIGDTTGVGSTANIGTVVYKISDYTFYGCAGTASSTVTWKQLNN